MVILYHLRSEILSTFTVIFVSLTSCMTFSNPSLRGHCFVVWTRDSDYFMSDEDRVSMVPSPKTKTETETRGFPDQDRDRDSRVPRPRPRPRLEGSKTKTKTKTSKSKTKTETKTCKNKYRDQDLSLENSKSEAYQSEDFPEFAGNTGLLTRTRDQIYIGDTSYWRIANIIPVWITLKTNPRAVSLTYTR